MKNTESNSSVRTAERIAALAEFMTPERFAPLRRTARPGPTGARAGPGLAAAQPALPAAPTAEENTCERQER